MSTNKTQRLEYRAAVQKLEQLLPSFNALRASAQTEEELAALEGSLLSWFEAKLDGEHNDIDLRAGYMPQTEDFEWHRDNWATSYRFNAVDLRELLQRYLQYENAKRIELLSLEGYISRLLQKKAVIDLWSGEPARAMWSARFYTYEGLGSQNLTAAEMSYDFDQGLATLPITGEQRLRVVGARILSGSNGQAGNSDTTVSVSDSNPLFATNDNENDLFEYERMDLGPVRLEIAFDLANREIINNISFDFVDYPNLGSVVIESIELVTDGVSRSVRDLVGEVGDEFWSFNSTASGASWSVTFLPAEATSVVLKIVANESYPVDTVTGVRRPRYGIGFKRIFFKRLTFDANGSIASTARSPAGALVVLPVTKVWPEERSLYNLTYEYALNQSGTWKPTDLNILDPGEQSTVLLQGNETAYEWRLSFKRLDTAFANTSQYTRDISVTPELGIQLTSASRFASPATVVLADRPKDDQVWVQQPQLLQVTDGTPDNYVLGTSTGELQKLSLPVNIFEMYDFFRSQDEDNVSATLLLGGQVMTVTDIDDSPGAGNVSLHPDGKHLMVHAATGGLDIVLSLPGELMSFDVKADGYYHTTRGLLDPNKDRISIWYEAGKDITGSVLVPPGQRFLRLPVRGIGSAVMVNTASGSEDMTEVGSYSLLDSASKYYVDKKEGVLYLHTPRTNAQRYRLRYSARPLVKLSADDYDIVSEGAKPKGVRIKPDAFVATEIRELLDNTNRPNPGATKDFSRWELRTETAVEYDDTIGSPGYRLSWDQIVPGTFNWTGTTFLANGKDPIEVPYIDGTSEFDGIVRSEKEETNHVVADATGKVVFKLAARDLWLQTWGIAFGDSSVFATVAAVPSAVGEYNVAANGTVTVYVGPGSWLPAGITIDYYYSNPDFDATDKYSINYAFGSLHTTVGVSSTAAVTYKTARYKIWYDVSAAVPDFTYNPKTKTVSVRTETMYPTNSLLRLVWQKRTGDATLEKFSSYFSPLLYLQGHVLQ